MKRFLISTTVLALLAGCTTTSPDVISRNDAQRMATVVDAVVLSTRPVVVDGSQSGIGAAAGGVLIRSSAGLPRHGAGTYGPSTTQPAFDARSAAALPAGGNA